MTDEKQSNLKGLDPKKTKYNINVVDAEHMVKALTRLMNNLSGITHTLTESIKTFKSLTDSMMAHQTTLSRIEDKVDNIQSNSIKSESLLDDLSDKDIRDKLMKGDITYLMRHDKHDNPLFHDVIGEMLEKRLDFCNATEEERKKIKDIVNISAEYLIDGEIRKTINEREIPDNLKSNHVTWYVDGSGWNGKQSKAVLFKGEKFFKEFIFNNEMTNNEMEYYAVIKALDEAKEGDVIYTDSLLVVNQLKGIYKVKASNLISFFNRAKKLKEKKKIAVEWISRDNNLAGLYIERKLLEREK